MKIEHAPSIWGDDFNIFKVFSVFFQSASPQGQCAFVSLGLGFFSPSHPVQTFQKFIANAYS